LRQVRNKSSEAAGHAVLWSGILVHLFCQPECQNYARIHRISASSIAKISHKKAQKHKTESLDIEGVLIYHAKRSQASMFATVACMLHTVQRVFYKLMAGTEHLTIRIKLIPGILFCSLGMAFLIFRTPWK
jgi:hypothetical protein